MQTYEEYRIENEAKLTSLLQNRQQLVEVQIPNKYSALQSTDEKNAQLVLSTDLEDMQQELNTLNREIETKREIVKSIQDSDPETKKEWEHAQNYKKLVTQVQDNPAGPEFAGMLLNRDSREFVTTMVIMEALKQLSSEFTAELNLKIEAISNATHKYEEYSIRKYKIDNTLNEG